MSPLDKALLYGVLGGIILFTVIVLALHLFGGNAAWNSKFDGMGSELDADNIPSKENTLDVKEPTAEQCSAKEKVYEDESIVGYAIWYPQMGGYVGKAVALLDKEWTERADGTRIGGCFDVLVWHDGEFPFGGDDGEQPARLHHCDPEQFIEFGQAVAELNDRGRQEG